MAARHDAWSASVALTGGCEARSADVAVAARAVAADAASRTVAAAAGVGAVVMSVTVVVSMLGEHRPVGHHCIEDFR